LLYINVIPLLLNTKTQKRIHQVGIGSLVQ
jgi:hypothetical protein